MEAAPLLKAAARIVLGQRLSHRMTALRRERAGRSASTYWRADVKADYYYGVWLKHLVLLQAAGLAGVPARVAEIGPGDSLGTGLAALLCGAQAYCGLDVHDFTEVARDQLLVDRLAELLRARTGVPSGWPDVSRHLDAGRHPRSLVPAEVARATTEERRHALKQARAAANGDGAETPSVRLVAPWATQAAAFRPIYDVVLSHSVLQYVEDLDGLCALMFTLLRPGGYCSHQLDLSSLDITRAWNGHLAYPDIAWRFLTARQSYPPRRRCLPDYLQALQRAGLEVVDVQRGEAPDGLARSRLARRFRHVEARDLRCRDAFVVARKPPAA